MKLATFFALGLTLHGFSTAHAQVTIDVVKITCDQYTGFKITDPQNIAIWLGGYYSAKRGQTVLDPQSFVANTRKLQSYCLRHPEAPVMEAVETLFGTSD